MSELDGQQKFTRYKSVRKASKASATERPNFQTPEMPTSQASEGLQRSMSRYKRPRAQTGGNGSSSPAMPSMPTMPTHFVQTQQGLALQSPTTPGSAARYQGLSTSKSHTQNQLPFRSQALAQHGQQLSAQAPVRLQSPPRQARQARRDTESSQMSPVVPGIRYVDPQSQLAAVAGLGSPVPIYSSPVPGLASPGPFNALHSPLYPQENEEDKVRRMIEADKARQTRLRDEQRKREAELVAEKVEKQRAEDEEERRKQEDMIRKEDEKRLVQDKLDEARRQHAERKKAQSRGLLKGRSGSQEGVPPPVGFSMRYGGRQEVAVPAASEYDELPVKQVDSRVIARPYQSPPKKAPIRKETISQPMSPTSPSRDMAPFITDSIAHPLSPGLPRPSMGQRPNDIFFDAPKSTANASERSAIVCYNNFKAIVTVDVNTTAENLLALAAKEMPNADVDPLNDVLMECFSQQEHLGLERRMRRYEVVQKIMDSWDFDRKNKFNIIKGNVGGTDNDLLVSSVTRRGEPRNTTSMRMYYGSATPNTKPSWGTFDKPQMCFLRADGQILVGKSEDERSATAACHMADFEIFIPTPEQMKRLKTKSKKMYVFAIKSQNKAAVYAESNNYVHYFCTRAKDDADRWFIAVQSWRSWYMIDKLGLGKVPEPSAGGWLGQLSHEQKGNSAKPQPNGLGSLGMLDEGAKSGEDIFSSIMNKYDAGSTLKKSANNDNDLDLSKDALGYDLGGLISRIPMNEHSYGNERAPLPQVSTGGQNGPLQSGGLRSASGKQFDRRGGPLVTIPANKTPHTGSLASPDAPFSPNSLLGRTYSQRKAQQEATGRSSIDQQSKRIEAMDWGRPLVDFTSPPIGRQTTGSSGRKVLANGAESGTLIGRAQNNFY